MGKKGPPYKVPDDAQWIVVLSPPVIQNNGQIDYSPLEYWLRALFGDQRAAKFIFEIAKPPGEAVIVELPSPEELPIPNAMYGEHSLRLGLKRRPWFNHTTGLAAILPYNFEQMGHPEDTRKLEAMISGTCEDEWLKFDLAIPYPPPPRPFDFSRIPQKARMFCRRPPDATPPPPDPMDIERYPTPPAQQQLTQPLPRTSRPGTDQPLFLLEDDSKPRIKIKKQEEGSNSSKSEPRLDPVEGPPSHNANTRHREPNAFLPRAKDELDNPLAAKREFANQDDAGSQKRFDLLNAVNRSHSPPEDDPLAVKLELEKQDGAGAQAMFDVLNAVNRGQSTPGDGPSDVEIKRDREGVGLNTLSSSSHQTGSRAPPYPAPNRDRDRERDRGRDRGNSYSSSSSNSWRDPDERGGRERHRESRDGERDQEPTSGGNRKRSFGHPDGRGREDRDSGDRQEHPDKRSRASYR